MRKALNNKTETESMRCSADLSLALRLSARRHGMTVSALLETLCRRYLRSQMGVMDHRFCGLGSSRCPARAAASTTGDR